ncbi:MAG: hypothetical protein IJ489_06870 [Clostridia bacterium]|nr:hypothetical protein [Clostridia bacterium]
MFDALLDGYKSVFDIDIENELFDFYVLGRLSETLDMHFNYGCSNCFTDYFLERFNRIKKKIISSNRFMRV